ncbi:MAG: hypothetical protein AB7I50_01130 [Vicinamibacterales bacterium]
MKNKLLLVGIALALASGASAAPNVTNVTQKGSLLVWPDIRVDGTWSTLVRVENDGSADVDVLCYWMDGNKNRVDFIFPLTKNQAVWFDAGSGRGTLQVNRFPQSAANGFTAANKHPFFAPGFGAYSKGLLACWAIDGGAQNQVKWNHLSGTATVYNPNTPVAYEYNAFAFYVPSGIDTYPVGSIPGNLNLNGLEYDACPLYLIGQFTPRNAPLVNSAPVVRSNRLVVSGCELDLKQDWVPVWTKLQFDVWNGEEVKFTGAFECANSWHETEFTLGTQSQPGVAYAFYDGIDSAAQVFDGANLGTYSARYRVQGVKSTQCDRTKPPSGVGSDVAAVTTQAVGLLGLQYTEFEPAGNPNVLIRGGGGTTLAAAGKFNGRISWDPEGVVPEGGLR